MSFIPIPCPPASGSGGPGFDVEEVFYLCDVLAGEIVGTAVATFTYDAETGAPVGPPVYVDPITGDPYIPQGTLQPCPSGSTAEFVLCDIQTDNSAVTFIRKVIQSPTGLVLEVQDQLLDGAPYVPTGTVGNCEPYTFCTPDSNTNLNADCGPGESPTQAVIANDPTNSLANSVYVDDATADPLCGGTWNNPAATLTPPFPVEETFRNATFDQPGPVLQGNGPSSAPPNYPFLTANPANAGEGNPPTPNDAAGSGWLRVSDLDSATNGLWQVPAPFSTSDGMTAAITHASHDGTTPGGDGMAFVFTDGSIAPQSAAIGGFGNLGLQNWEGGYVAVVLDEYGQTCTCNHSAPPVIDANPGPCGFCTNTISIQLAGAARVGASCQCCTIAQMPLTPKFVNQTTRAQPLRLYTSIIEEAGQTYVSAGIDWNDGNGIVQYFDRVNVTACAGPPPATLRMAAYGGSGGAYRAVKEFQDATARPAGEIHWRAFPIVTDVIEPCVTLVNLTGSVDVTFNSDTQPSANGDPEAYFWLVNEATGTVVARAEKSSIPGQVGVTDTLTWNASVPPGDLVNLRVYVGSESRDQNGEYDTLWENLVIDATGTGCPAEQVRTLAISAPCPIPVTIVGGGDGDGGGGGTTVFNAPSTFEDELVCITIAGDQQQGFRREVRSADGNIVIEFWGLNGTPVIPDSWIAGPCDARGVETQKVCDSGSATSLIARYSFDDDGNLVDVQYYTLDGIGPVTPVGTILEGGCCDVVALGEACYDPGGGPVRITGVRRCDPNNAPAFLTFWYEVETGTFVGGSGDFTFVDCPTPGGGSVAEFILCDDNGPFIRKFIQDEAGTVTDVVDLTLAGAAYVTVGTVDTCPIEVELEPTEFEFEEEILCDSNGPFFRRTTFNTQTQTYGPVADFTLAGAPYVTVGVVRVCSLNPFDAEEEILCDDNGSFIRRYVYDTSTGALTATSDFTLGGAAYVTVGTVVNCNASIDSEQQILCDDGAANIEFLRTYTYVNGTGPIAVDTELDGTTPYVVVGEGVVCSECCPFNAGEGCTNIGSGTYVSIRNPDGTFSTVDPVTGAAVAAINIVPCPAQPVTVTPTPIAIDSTVQRQVGAGAIVVAAGARSITFISILGTNTVQIAADPVVTVVPGVTLTWSVDDRDESLLNAHTFTGIAGSDFYVITTRV